MSGARIIVPEIAEPKSMQRLLAALTFLGCIWLFPATGSAQKPASPTVEFTILHFNDVYEVERPRDQTLGGLSRVAALRTKLVAENPRTYAMFSGDALSPSPIGGAVIDGDELAGRQMVAVLNVMGLDFATFGNHEFDLKKDQLSARLKESTFTWISSNATDAVGRGLPGVPGEVILQVHQAGTEIRVGLIGLSIDSTRPDYVRFQDPVSVAREKARKLTGSCDVIIALTHLAIDEDRRVATAVPEIHLILGGHEHRHSFECKATAERFSAPIAKADSNAKTVTVHRLAFNTQTRHLTIRSQLVPISGEPDPRTGAAPSDVDLRTDRLAKYWKQRGFAGLKDTFGRDPSEVVAQSDVPLDGLESSVRYHPTNLTELIGQAMMASVPDAQAAIYNSGSIRVDDVLGPGLISVYDVYRILPYPGKVIAAQLPGDLLIELLEKSVTIPDEGGFLQMTKIERNNEKVWLIGGKPIAPGTLYPLAINDYLIQGRELIYGEVRNPQTINARLKKIWEALPDAEKKLPAHPGIQDREIRHALIHYMNTNQHGRIAIPPGTKGEDRELPASAVDWPVVEVDVDRARKGNEQTP
jgi:5'-nucleotidase / UDP-sugar diphosphatase